MIKILAPTEQEKQELLEASKHIHDLRDLDTDIQGANLLAQPYHNQDLKKCHSRSSNDRGA